MKLCQQCKSYKGCNGHAEYSIPEVKYCPYQIIYIIENSETIKDGRWPKLELVDKSSGKAFKAYFVGPIEIIAEVEARLQRTGKDGMLLWDELKGGQPIRQEAKTALYYITGYRRKRTPYPTWVAKRRYRSQKRV